MTSRLNSTPLSQVPSSPLFADRGANFCTHVLQEKSGLLVYRPTILSEIFWRTFVGLGALAMIAGIMAVAFGGFPESLAGLAIGGGIGALFVAIGHTLGSDSQSPRRIDLRSKVVSVPRSTGDSKETSESFHLSEILALQIVEKSVSGGDDQDYTSYELNFVLKDLRRVNLVDHGNRNRIHRDAEKIANAIRCPVVKVQQG